MDDSFERRYPMAADLEEAAPLSASVPGGKGSGSGKEDYGATAGSKQPAGEEKLRRVDTRTKRRDAGRGVTIEGFGSNEDMDHMLLNDKSSHTEAPNAEEEPAFLEKFRCGCCSLSNCCRHFPKAGFLQIMKFAQSGDVILFDNPCNLGTCIISCFTRSDWDHVGIVIRKPGGMPHEVYLLEALSPKVLRDELATVLHWVTQDEGEGVMYWRPLKHPGKIDAQHPNGTIDPALEQKLWDLSNEFNGKPYGGFDDMVESTVTQDNRCWDSIFGKCCCEVERYNKETAEEKAKSVFCSQLAAECYIKSGLIDVEDERGDQLFAYQYLPKDFSSDVHNRLQDNWARDKQGNNKYDLLPEFKIVRKLRPGYKYDPDKTEEEEDAEAEEREKAAGMGGGAVASPAGVHVGEQHDRNTFVT
jgi:hypothetical protein